MIQWGRRKNFAVAILKRKCGRRLSCILAATEVWMQPIAQGPRSGTVAPSQAGVPQAGRTIASKPVVQRGCLLLGQKPRRRAPRSFRDSVQSVARLRRVRRLRCTGLPALAREPFCRRRHGREWKRVPRRRSIGLSRPECGRRLAPESSGRGTGLRRRSRELRRSFRHSVHRPTHCSG